MRRGNGIAKCNCIGGGDQEEDLDDLEDQEEAWGLEVVAADPKQSAKVC